GSVYNKLSYDEIKPLLPTIHEAVVKPAPSGIMFADGIRLAGLKLLAKHHIKDGIPLCIELMEIERWNKKSRIMGNLKILDSYGAAAKEALPEMRQLALDLKKHREQRMLVEHIKVLDALITKLEMADASTSEPLRSLKD
ncbi:MAG: acetylesterase, partial [Luteolibacter sp.]